MLELQPDSLQTSAPPQPPLAIVQMTSAPDYHSGWAEVVLVARRTPNAAGVLPSPFGSAASTKRPHYAARIVVSSQDIASVWAITSRGMSCFVVPFHGQRALCRSVESTAPVAGPSEDFRTPDRWATTNDIQSVAEQHLSELHTVVEAILRSRLLPSTAEFDALLAHAGGRQGSPADINEWSRRLAQDVSDLSD